jgi:hypothetical protein|tara:strand:+ start:84 stop:602 length:519 start_codon:yes stop_codon:yes gene_type:complete
MRNIEELYEASAEDLPDLYCDMDQVLVDFLGGAEKVVGAPFAKSDNKTRWSKISGTKDFWANLDWMPGAKKLYQRVAKYDTRILSAFSGKDSNSKSGKMKWLGKNTKVPRGKTHLVKREDKKAFAKTKEGKPNVLIDDYIKNIQEWESAGGIGIRHTEVSKTLAELKKLGFK